MWARPTSSTAGRASRRASTSPACSRPTAATGRPDTSSRRSSRTAVPWSQASATSTTTARRRAHRAPGADLNGLTDNGQAYVVYGKPSPPRPTKFYVVNDGSTDRTYEYTATSIPVENYALNTGNTAPRGAASTAAGDKVWVVDANKKVYVYNTSGGLLGSWTAGTPGLERHGRGHRHQRHRRLDRRRQGRQGVPVHRRREPALGHPERRQQLQPEQRQHQPRRTS